MYKLLGFVAEASQAIGYQLINVSRLLSIRADVVSNFELIIERRNLVQ